MRRGWVRPVLGAIVAAAILAGCAMSPNAGGWWDEGVHAVDGYWVTEERPCTPETDEECTAAIDEATAMFQTRNPGAVITAAVTAGYPVQHGRDANEITINRGLDKPRFVILDLADGSQRTIGLTCGPDLSASGNIVCWESEFEVWRTIGS